MAELPEFLTRKVGPLPVGAYLAVGAAGLAYSQYRTKSKGGGTVIPLDVSSGEGAGIVPLSGGSVPLAQGYYPNNDATTKVVINTNADWIREGTKYLADLGRSGTEVRSLLQDYIEPSPDGYPLERYNQIMKVSDDVIAKLGPPPNQSRVPTVQDTAGGNPNPTPTPDPIPVTPSPSTPTGTIDHPVQMGETLVPLAQFYYGDGNSWWTIYSANQAAIDALPGNTPNNPVNLQAGMILKIPATDARGARRTFG